MENKQIYDVFKQVTMYSKDTCIPIPVMTRVLNLSMNTYGTVSDEDLINALNEYQPQIIDQFYGHNRLVGIDIADDYRDHLRNEDADQVETGINDFVRKFLRQDPLLKRAMEENFGVTKDGSGHIESNVVVGTLYGWIYYYPANNRLEKTLKNGEELLYGLHAFLGNKIKQTDGNRFVIDGIVAKRRYRNGVMIELDNPNKDVADLNLLKRTLEGHNVKGSKATKPVDMTPKLIMAEPVKVPETIPTIGIANDKPLVAGSLTKAEPVVDAKPISLNEALKNDKADWKKTLNFAFNDFLIWLGKAVKKSVDSTVSTYEIMALIKYWCDKVSAKPNKTLKDTKIRGLIETIKRLRAVYDSNNISDKPELLDKFSIIGDSIVLDGWVLLDNTQKLIAKFDEINKSAQPVLFTPTADKEIIDYRENLLNSLSKFINAELVMTKSGSIDCHELYDQFSAKVLVPKGIVCRYPNFCKYLRKVVSDGAVTYTRGNDHPAQLRRYAWKNKPGTGATQFVGTGTLEIITPATTSAVAELSEQVDQIMKMIKPAEQPEPKSEPKPEPKPIPKVFTNTDIQNKLGNIIGMIKLAGRFNQFGEAIEKRRFNVSEVNDARIKSILTKAHAQRMDMIIGTGSAGDKYSVRIDAIASYGNRADYDTDIMIQFGEHEIVVSPDSKGVYTINMNVTGIPYAELLIKNLATDFIDVIDYYVA